jgi:hypothetical protein
LLVSACLSLPLLEFVQNATRAGIESSERSVYALPVTQVLGLILPIFSQAEWVVYLGSPLFLLAVVAVLGRAEGSVFWASVGLAAVLIALGDATPLYAILTALVPGLGLLRVPARWMFLTVFSVSVLAAFGLDLLIRGGMRSKLQRRIRISAVAIGLFASALTGSLLIAADIIAPTLTVSVVLFSSCAALLTILYLRWTRRSVFLILGWLVIVGLDLALVDAHLLDARQVEGVEPHREAIAKLIASPPGTQRVFSPSYSIPQHMAARAGLELADGVNPLQIGRYWKFMADALGFDEGQYSVTLPPFPSGDPRQPQPLQWNLQKLGEASVTYITSDYPLEMKDLTFLDRRGDIYLYQNPFARPRAWIEAPAEGGDAQWKQADAVDWSPNAIQIEARGPGRLVVSEISYPGWVAFLDGRETVLAEAQGVFRALELGPGEHQVELIFRPFRVRIGAVITLLSLIMLGGLWLRR